MPSNLPAVWIPSLSAVAGLNTALINGNNTAQIYAAVYWDGSSTSKFYVTDYSLASTLGPISLSGTPINTPDIVLGNGSGGADDYTVAVAYPTISGVVVDLFHFSDNGSVIGSLSSICSLSYSGTVNTVHIDGVADASMISGFGYPKCRYAAVTWDDTFSGNVYAAHVDMQASSSGTLSPQLIGSGKDPDVAAIGRGTPTDWALITYTDASNSNLYYVEWEMGSSPSLPATLDAMGPGSLVSIPRIDAIDDYNVNAIPSSDAVYKVAAQVYNYSTGLYEVRTYDNLLYATPTYWTSSNVVSLPVSYSTPPYYDHYAPTVSMAGPAPFGGSIYDGTQYMVPHFTHGGAGSDILYMEPIDYTVSNALGSPQDDYWVSEYTPSSTSLVYVSASSSNCNDVGDCGLIAWAYPDGSGGINIEYKITPYTYFFKHGNTISQGRSVNNAWQVYPNPANDQLIIANTGEAGASSTYTITDMLGREQLCDDIQNGNKKIDVSRLEAGNYLIKISSQDGTSEVQRVHFKPSQIIFRNLWLNQTKKP